MRNLQIRILCKIMKADKDFVLVEEENSVFQVLLGVWGSCSQVGFVFRWSLLTEKRKQRVVVGPLPNSFEVVIFGSDGEFKIELVFPGNVVAFANAFVIVGSSSVDVDEHGSVVCRNPLGSV